MCTVASVLWQASDGGSELCVMDRTDRGWRLTGTVLTHDADRPMEIRYAVSVDATWATTAVAVDVSTAGGPAQASTEVAALWSGDQRPPEFGNCLDVDLSFTPATNTLPIRRLGLDVGDEAEIEVAWLVWPDLDVRPVRQTYARLGEYRYRYAQDDFVAEIAVDDEGLVSQYEGLWRAVART